MPDVDCNKLQNDLDAAGAKAKEALNELYDRSGELSRAADDIKNTGLFEPGDMTNREIVDTQLDVIEHDREVTESQIKDLQQDWRDAGAGDSNVKELQRLDKRLGELDDSRDKLNTIDDAFDKASDKFDEAEQKKDDKLHDWSEHCEDDPPLDDDDDDGGDDRPKQSNDPKKPAPPPSP